MTAHSDNELRLIHTGVPGLDAVLGGGLPEYSFNIIAGGPGAGKTTLAQQIVFAHAANGGTALYFTVLGEPSIKMLRHLQQYDFFDAARLNERVQFVNLSTEAMEHDLKKVLERIVAEVEAVHPGLVVVDSFRTVVHAGATHAEVQEFVQRLALHLTSWQATTFLVGEYLIDQSHDNPIFTVADGLVWLTQRVDQSACTRRLHVAKLRGCAQMAGYHTFLISRAGLRVFPRTVEMEPARSRVDAGTRASTGVVGLDDMMGGGIPAGAAALLIGPSGSGKSVLARQFIAAGAAVGEPGVIAVFEERPDDYLDRAETFGPPLRPLVEQGVVEMLYLRPLDLTVDEALESAREKVERTGAKRLVIDSLAGFELTLTPSFREEFREAIYRLVSALTGRGVTILMTTEIVESFFELRFSPHLLEVLADVVVMQRYVELRGKLERVTAVVKLRHGKHSADIRRYAIEGSGLVVGETLEAYRGLLTGVPVRDLEEPQLPVGLTRDEANVLRAVEHAGAIGAKELAQRAGLRAAAFKRAIARLLALGHAQETRRKGVTVYRPIAASRGDADP